MEPGTCIKQTVAARCFAFCDGQCMHQMGCYIFSLVHNAVLQILTITLQMLSGIACLGFCM